MIDSLACVSPAEHQVIIQTNARYFKLSTLETSALLRRPPCVQHNILLPAEESYPE